MTLSEFNKLWDFVKGRCEHTVQERSELEYVFNLMLGCESYLEVGTAEGNSLYVLGHAVKNKIDYVDLGEKHTEQPRYVVIEKLIKLGKNVTQHIGDSTKPETLADKGKYDCVLIDAGHSYENVLADARLYAPLATKYVFFHDIQLKPVADAIETFRRESNLGKYTTFINSDSFGYGIIEVGK